MDENVISGLNISEYKRSFVVIFILFCPKGGKRLSLAFYISILCPNECKRSFVILFLSQWRKSLSLDLYISILCPNEGQRSFAVIFFTFCPNGAKPFSQHEYLWILTFIWFLRFCLNGENRLSVAFYIYILCPKEGRRSIVIIFVLFCPTGENRLSL